LTVEEKSSALWIILGVVAAVIVVIVIALIAVIAMRKTKSSADLEADGMALSGAGIGADKSSIDGKVGGSKMLNRKSTLKLVLK
jgi:sensor histidine kinase regulating citrate/malate metabolism